MKASATFISTLKEAPAEAEVVSHRLMMRAEVRDYVTPFPKDLIVPSPGNKINGWLHDITPLFGISYLF